MTHDSNGENNEKFKSFYRNRALENIIPRISQILSILSPDDDSFKDVASANQSPPPQMSNYNLSNDSNIISLNPLSSLLIYPRLAQFPSPPSPPLSQQQLELIETEGRRGNEIIRFRSEWNGLINIPTPPLFPPPPPLNTLPPPPPPYFPPHQFNLTEQFPADIDSNQNN